MSLVFHRGWLQFLQDYVAWSEGCEFPYKTGRWYWLSLSREAEVLRAKAWADGEPEPAEWMIVWTDFDESAAG